MSGLFGWLDGSTGESRRARLHGDRENTGSRRQREEHIRRQARAAREQAAKRQRRQREEADNAKRIAKRREAAKKDARRGSSFRRSGNAGGRGIWGTSEPPRRGGWFS